MSSDDLDSLFAEPPAGFIEARRRVVAALRDAGRKDEAKTVEKIPRPSLALWTVNQIARRDRELVRRLGEITGRLQSAAGPEYGAAAAEHRNVLHELRERAGEVIADAGQEVAPHLVQRVIANLRAAASTPETRATLEQGRLVRDVEEPEAEGLFGLAGAAAAPADEAQRDSVPASLRQAAATPAADPAAAAEAKARERARAKELSDAEREVKRRRGAEVAARKDVVGAERAVAAARESLNVKEVRAASARAAAEAAAQALAQAEADLARLSKA